LLFSVCFILMSANLWAASCCSTNGKGVNLDSNDFIPLFDGKTLDGWEVLPGGKWNVVNGAIVGSQDKSEARHGMLLSKKTYSDFVVKLKYKSLKGNSGFYFRAQRVGSKVSVKGFQAEIDSEGGDVGGLYETGGRAWVCRVSPDKVKTFYNTRDWNEMVVKAVGKNTTVYVNGVKTAELKNDKGLTKGHFGLQLHGGQDMHVEFKDIEIHDLSDDMDYTALKESGFTQMFNGKDLTGWQTTGNWIVEENNVVTLKPRPGEHGWLAGKYENWVDITEDIEDRAVIPYPGAEPLKGWLAADGTQYYSRSSALAVEAAQAYVPGSIETYGYTQRFVDVSSCIDLFEDYHPLHTFDRRADMQHLRNLYQYYNDVGQVTRGEFGNAWVVDKVDMLM